MSEWTKVVTQPLGLVGFALFLIFGYIAKMKKSDEFRWLSPVAVALAAIALIGGLRLAFVQTLNTITPVAQTKDAPVSNPRQPNQVQQSSSGAGSPNIDNVHGNVTVTEDLSKDQTNENKAQTQKSNHARQ